MSTDTKLWGVLAEFDGPASLYQACEQMRDAGFRKWDAHTPFPVHGLEKAMGLGRSHVPWIALVSAFTGTAIAFLGQSWVAKYASQQVISAKPFISWPAFIPVTFEVSVLLGAAGSVIGMLVLNRLPQLYHSLFRSERFERFSDNAFFISVEAADPQFDPDKTSAALRQAGAVQVELIEE
jgi:hypothetical protein